MLDFFKKLFVKINKLDDFVNVYKESAKEVSMPSYAYMNWGIKLLDVGEDKKAMDMLEKSIEMPYANSESYVNLAIVLAKEEKYDKAIEYLKKAIRMDNENSKAYQVLKSLY